MNSNPPPTDDSGRIDSVIARLVEGEHEREIEADVSREMSIDHRDRLLAAVAERLKAAAKCDPDVAVGFALEALRRLYAKAIETGDIAQARGAIKDWITLALRHNALGDEEADAIAEDEPPPSDGRPVERERTEGEGRKRKATSATPISRRANPAVRRPRSPKKT